MAMKTVPIIPGTVVVHEDRLVLICETAQNGEIRIRDLVSGTERNTVESEISARPPAGNQRKADQRHADFVRANPCRFRLNM